MSLELEEQAVRQEYRITGDPSWRVEKRHNGQWVVAYYCSTEGGAAEQLEKCIRRQLEWNRMTPDERILATLR